MNRKNALLTIFKTEAKLSLRGGDMILFGIFMPIGIVLLMGFITKPETLASSFGGIASIGMLASGLMGIPLTISSYRHSKILKRYCVTPTSPLLLLFSNTMYQLLFTLVSGLLVTLIAVLGFKVQVASWYNFIGSFLFAIFVTFSFGYLIASVSPDEKMTGNLCSLFYFPALFLSGSTVPYAIMPNGLKIFANIFPITHTNLFLESAVSGESVSFSLARIIPLAVIAIICYAVSVKKFKWE